MNDREKNVSQYCDGEKTSKQIAYLSGDNHKYVQRVMLKYDLPRRERGSATGELNGSYCGGRRIDRDGYVLVSAPKGHPYARMTEGRHTGVIYEHRLIMERKLGRFLLPGEVVDHIDGLRLHNHEDNLRHFPCNADHLKQTITGQTPKWSQAGVDRMFSPHSQRKGLQPLNNYQKMKVSGDARLRQILLASLSLGIDSPYLLGSYHHLKKAGIVDFSRSNLELLLAELNQRYA